ncbi:methyl-accepting chemotaxis protein [Pluralibacter gergoviae]|uniref:methyl-accepting chemotaxis protein n=1 Tax=Pluralibacter gergoviae TaxID=61647 RepID=UPI002EDA34C4
MKSLKISALIKVILMALCISIVVISVYGLKSMYTVASSFDKIQTLTTNIRNLSQATRILNNAKGDINSVNNDPDVPKAVMEAKAANIKVNLDKARVFQRKFMDSPNTTVETGKLGDVINAAFNGVLENYAANMHALETYNNRGFDNEQREKALDEAIMKYMDLNVKIQDEMSDSFDKDRESFLVTVSILLLIAVVFSFISYLLIKKNIFDRLKIASTALDKIGEGDLCHEFDVGSPNEIGLMLQSLKRMQSSITKIITAVRSASDQINLNSEEIESSNHALASRTEEQASALQQTAASMEEIKTTVSNNAENARQANGLSQQARAAADNGSTVMSSVVSTMDKISQSARKISEINSVIDGIANQTNILALNAAVEAARAGEQGRGFSVVATEVRNLAKRSADAAKEISHLINESVKNVDDGARLIADAGKSMDEIVSSVTHVSNIMQEITHASDEQNTGVGQVAMAINEMDLATQQNAAMVEESAAITENMSSNARNLFDTVSVFTINAAEHGTASVQSRRAPTVAASGVKAVKEKEAPKMRRPAAVEEEWTEF